MSKFCCYRDRLRTVMVAESRAYGFTLLMAGSAMFLLDHQGVPNTADVFMFAGGALAAIFLIVLFSFRRLGRPIFLKLHVSTIPWGLIHAVSVLGGLGAALLAAAASPRNFAYVTVAFAGTLVYNLLLGLESEIASAVTIPEQNEQDT